MRNSIHKKINPLRLWLIKLLVGDRSCAMNIYCTGRIDFNCNEYICHNVTPREDYKGKSGVLGQAQADGV